MPYLDGHEEEIASTPPAFCPMCKGAVITQWVTQFTRAFRTVLASPRHVCKKCKIAVRVMTLPSGPLHATRGAARAAGRRRQRKRS